MRKLFLTALLTLPLLVCGCSKNDDGPDPIGVYQVGIFPGADQYVNRCGYDIKDNELYQKIHDGVKAINQKYDRQILASDDSEAMRVYDQAYAELKELKKSCDELQATGKDFGACTFLTEEFCKVNFGFTELKTSEKFSFEYTPNYRVLIDGDLNLNTEFAEEESGNILIKVYDGEGDLQIMDWKVFNSDGTPSEADFIKGIEVKMIEEPTGNVVYYDFTCKAEQKKFPGDYYVLVTTKDNTYKTADIYDLMFNVSHKTIE